MLRRNAGLKAFALLLAIFLWFYRLIIEENPIAEKRLRLPVIVRELPTGLAVAQQPGPVEVMVSGPKSVLESAAEAVRVWVNLNGARAGTHWFPVHVTVPERLTLVRRSPDRVALALEPVSRKILSVEYYLVGTAPSSYVVGEPEVQPVQVKITGLPQDVLRVAHALVGVNVAYARVGITRPAAVTPVDAQGDEVTGVTVTPPRVQVRVPITRTRAYQTVPVVLSTTGRVAEGYRIAKVEIKPPVVTISGEAEALRGIAYVETEPLDLKDAAERISQPVRLVAPRGVQTLGAQQVTVTVEIVKG